MIVEFDQKTKTYSLREGKFVRARLSEESAKQFMDAPEANCDAILRAARRAPKPIPRPAPTVEAPHE